MPRLSRYAGVESAIVDIENKRGLKKPTMRGLHEGNRYKCKICGEEIMTYVHAEKHGYTSKVEMINAGLAVMIVNKKARIN